MKNLLIILLTGLASIGWTHKTPLGIKIQASKAAIAQYEKQWGYSWNEIDWKMVDKQFLSLQQAYQTKTKPEKITVKILPWNSFCEDKETPGTKEFYYVNGGQGMCIDGLMFGNLIYIHLGDDPGIEERGFCQTALPYELGHIFLKDRKDPCWYYEFEGDCQSHYRSTDLCK